MNDTLGPYRILEPMGSGGLGDVYRARDTRHGRTVAIKVIPPAIRDDPGRRERLLDDARAAAALSHPTIATLYEVGEDGDELFLVFDFLAGEPLTTVIGGRPLHPRRAVDLAAQMADAVADAHAAGVVHGDITPANVIVTPRGTAKMLDCGLAAWTHGGRRRAATSEHDDVAALGALVFEMLTGHAPSAAPQPPSTVNATVPIELDEIVARALGCTAASDYAPATLAAELRGVSAVLEERSRAVERESPFVPRRRRRSVWPWIVAALALAGLGAAGWTIYGR